MVSQSLLDSKCCQRTLQQLKECSHGVRIEIPIEVTTGVLQGDVPEPFLFIMIIDYLLKRATEAEESRV